MILKKAIALTFLLAVLNAAPLYAGNGLDLILAAGNADNDRIETLLNRGTDINAQDRSGFTALHYAARYGHISTARLLIKRGADVNVKSDLMGYTALMNAIVSGKLTIIRELLDAGADVTIRNDDGVTALAFAKESGDPMIVELLKERGARR